MHHASLPLTYVPGRSHLEESLAPLADTTRSWSTRRSWLAGVVGFATGAGALAVARVLGGAAADAVPGAPPTGNAPRGSVEWALGLLSRPSEELLSAAGDLERVSMRHRTDARLVPCFQRLADLVVEESAPYADEAGACAARSLGRLGRPDLLQAFSTRLGGRADRAHTRDALERWLERLRRGKGR